MIVAIVMGVLAIGVLLFANQQDPRQVANRFMISLAKGDVNQLCELSYYQGDPEDLKKQWTFATQTAGKHFLFTWQLKDEKVASPTEAAVQMDFTSNALSSGSYSENKELPMVKVDGKWKVDVTAIDRSIYPDLPRNHVKS